MNASQIIFYIISAFILVSGILAVSSRKIFRSAIWLLFSLIGIAGLYFWLEVEFIAAVQIVVYVGGIVVLIIFSIFLPQKSGSEMDKPSTSRKGFAIAAVVLGFALVWQLISHHDFKQISTQPFDVNVANIGSQLLSTTEHGYILPFEVVSILLLAAMIGCIVVLQSGKCRSSSIGKRTLVKR